MSAPLMTPPLDPPTPRSKRDLIRKKLREKEKQLSKLMRSSSARMYEDARQSGVEPAGRYGIGKRATSNKLFDLRDKDESDRKDAVRALSNAALEMRRRFDERNKDFGELELKYKQLTSTLDVNAKAKSKLENELESLKAQMAKASGEIETLQVLLREKEDLMVKMFEDQKELEKKEAELKEDLEKIRREGQFFRNEALSKVEQIETYEYQVLQKNSEIDELRQSLNEKLKRIVELELDLEIQTDFVGESLMVSPETSSVGTASVRSSTTSDRARRRAPARDADAPSRASTGTFKRFLLRKRLSSSTAGSHDQRGSPFESHSQSASKWEARYQRLRAKFTREVSQLVSQIEQLKQENGQLLVKILHLEKTHSMDENSQVEKEEWSTSDEALAPDDVSEQGGSNTEAKEMEVVFDNANACPSDLPTRKDFLEERLTKLERERDQQGEVITRLRSELNRNLEMSRWKEVEYERVIEKYQREAGEKAERTAARDGHKKKISFRVEAQGRDRPGHSQRLESEEAKASDEVSRLEKEGEVKDKKIELLRSELVDLRLRLLHQEREAQSKSNLDSIPENSGSGARVIEMASSPPGQERKKVPSSLTSLDDLKLRLTAL